MSEEPIRHPFGFLPPLKAEGSPVHPDEMENFPDDATPEQIAAWRKRQLEAYETYWRERGLRGMSYL